MRMILDRRWALPLMALISTPPTMHLEVTFDLLCLCYNAIFNKFSPISVDGLDPIDFDGLQILTNSTLVTDPSTEDHFRLDRM